MSASRASIAGNSLFRPLNRSRPVWSIAAIAVASAASSVASWATSVRRACGPRRLRTSSAPLTDRLTPGAQVVGGASNDACTGRPPISHPEELHVHRGRLGVPKALAAGQQLLERMGQQLVCDHVLPAGHQLAGCDLVEICG